LQKAAISIAHMTRILVAEDDALTMQLIEFKLKQQGYEVMRATDGELALKIMAVEKPALLILDGMMPVLDGFEVLRRVRADESLKHIPILMLTARSRDNDVVTGLELGANDYMTKPFSPTELLARVKKILSSPKR
jgi:DNA-binding response OmpR family regulator